MCGLFGAIGEGFDPRIVRTLAILNEARGNHAIGFFNSKGAWLKQAIDPLVAMGHQNFSDFMEGTDEWFIAGHTRQSTQAWGKKKTEHAHPFLHGSVIGSHNGYVLSSADYEVDSMLLFDLLDEHKSNYQEALKEIEGYWGLTWFDSDTETLYLQSHSADLAMAWVGDVIYYSSDVKHLEAALGPIDGNYIELDAGKTYSFNWVDGHLETAELAAFKSEKKNWALTRSQRSIGFNGNNTYYKGNTSYKNWKSTEATSIIDSAADTSEIGGSSSELKKYFCDRCDFSSNKSTEIFFDPHTVEHLCSKCYHDEYVPQEDDGAVVFYYCDLCTKSTTEPTEMFCSPESREQVCKKCYDENASLFPDWAESWREGIVAE